MVLRVGKGGTAASIGDALKRIGKGGLIEVLPGTYTEEVVLGPDHEGVTLQATEPGKAIVRLPEDSKGTTLVRITQARRVRLKWLTLDGLDKAERAVHVVGKLDGDAAAWQPAADIQIIANRIANLASEAILLEGPMRKVQVKENVMWNVPTGIFHNLARSNSEQTKLVQEATDELFVVNNSMHVRQIGVRFSGPPLSEKGGKAKKRVYYQNNLIVGATRGGFVIEPYRKDLGPSEEYRQAYHVMGNSVWPASKTRADILPPAGNASEDPAIGSLDPAQDALFLRYDESSPIAKRAVKGEKVEEYARPFIGAFPPYSAEEARELVKARKPAR
ncbi:MAG: hypothetical protein HY000_18535 [Planctomycetes bacterium]|nr:hypothetical protein [Planctomycetota bacterium]